MKAKKTSEDIRKDRTNWVGHCTDKLIVAFPWPKNGDNIGTVARTCDALQACLAIPNTKEAQATLRRGNTIGIDKVHLHYIKHADTWLRTMRADNWHIIGVELAHDAVQLAKLRRQSRRNILVCGNESTGIPKTAWEYFHEIVEIPMRGCGNSLNVSVAASLVAYKLEGLV